MNAFKRPEPFKIKVLDVEYTVVFKTKQEEPYLEKVAAFCDTSIKTIVILWFEQEVNSLKDLKEFTERCLRHEFVHALLFECGLDGESEWAKNEEMIDWIAIQFNRLYLIFADAMLSFKEAIKE